MLSRALLLCFATLAAVQCAIMRDSRELPEDGHIIHLSAAEKSGKKPQPSNDHILSTVDAKGQVSYTRTAKQAAPATQDLSTAEAPKADPIPVIQKFTHVKFPMTALNYIDMAAGDGQVEKLLESSGSSEIHFTLVVSEQCDVTQPVAGETVSTTVACRVADVHLKCGCESAAAAGTYSCKGEAPTADSAFFGDCVDVAGSTSMLHQPDTVIYAITDPALTIEARKTAAEQIAQLAKTSSAKTQILVNEHIQKQVLDLLSGHAALFPAKEKIRKASLVRFGGTR